MSSPSTALYDAPGPRARRLTVIVSVAAGIGLVAAAYLFVYRPLATREQFTMEKWGPIVNPADPSFALLWQRIAIGFQATLTAAAFAIVTSLLLGTGVAILRVQLKSWRQRRYGELDPFSRTAMTALAWSVNAITRFCVEVFRGLPVVMTIFFVAQVLPQLGLDLGRALWYLVIGLALYNMIVIGEILRSGMEGLPRGQREAATAIGLRPLQTTILILLPQAFRVMLPALISQLVVVLKDTSLGFIISYEEVLRVTSQAIQILDNPIQLYFVVGLIYIVINYLLSRLATYLQVRLSRSRKISSPGQITKRAPVVGTEAQVGAQDPV